MSSDTIITIAMAAFLAPIGAIGGYKVIQEVRRYIIEQQEDAHERGPTAPCRG